MDRLVQFTYAEFLQLATQKNQGLFNSYFAAVAVCEWIIFKEIRTIYKNPVHGLASFRVLVAQSVEYPVFGRSWVQGTRIFPAANTFSLTSVKVETR